MNISHIEKRYGRENRAEFTGDWHPVKRVWGYGDISTITLKATLRSFGDMVINRCMDIAGSLVGLVISIPGIVITEISQKLRSRGPLFFKPKHVGLNRSVFEIYKLKLRSMYAGAEGQKKLMTMTKKK